jgi:hypothetical protein
MGFQKGNIDLLHSKGMRIPAKWHFPAQHQHEQNATHKLSHIFTTLQTKKIVEVAGMSQRNAVDGTTSVDVSQCERVLAASFCVVLYRTWTLF